MAYLEARGFSLIDADPSMIEPFVDRMDRLTLRDFEDIYLENPVTSLHKRVEMSGMYAVILEDRVVAFTGLDGDIMWVLFSEEVWKNRMKFVRASRLLVDWFQEQVDGDELSVMVPQRNSMVIQWAMLCGFFPRQSVRMDNGNDYKVTMLQLVRCKPADVVADTAIRPEMH